MKSRSSSPQTSPQVVRRYRVDTASTAGVTASPSHSLRKTSLRIEELPQLAMNGFQPSSSPSNGNTSVSTAPGLLSPLPNGSRRLSGDNASTPRSDSAHVNGLTPSPTPNGTSSPGPENSPAWSSAVGHATTSGKSGRVIERLMTENDRLKREVNEQRIKGQELEKSLQTYKPQIEALRQENDNLSHARDVDSGLITRRDRKIEEMKAELVVERQRREKAETLARQRQQEKDDHEEQSRRDMQQMVESTKHATLHAEILETSHRQLAAEYRARAAAWKTDLGQITDAREQDRLKLARLDVVSDQMRQELERARKLNGEIMELWEGMRGENEARLQGMEDETKKENERVRQLSVEMDRVVGEMRWVMGVKRDVKDAEV
ncbi:mother-specific HO expression [Saxophila tyrrhenica]|uniref:Mother-specific HO expression n=1 Tax=Saxophila tyrrhenica TaxID=1690608 RepID=A0AAV9PP58_9PEZI|nr:mother-specific HO expression [Saxophila tyrrhenica]